MKAYRYNFETFVFEEEQDRQLDPIATAKSGKEVYLMPAFCTDIEPPEAKEGYDIVWNQNVWEYKEKEKSNEDNTVDIAEEIMYLDSQYKASKEALQKYYIEFMIAGDTVGMESIKQELESLATQYDADLKELKESEE